MPYTGLFPPYSHQTAESSHTMLTCLTCLTAGVASSLHCVLELDNSRLLTQSVTRSSNPVWNKQFVLMVRDMTSCLAISVLDRERNMKTHLLARLSLPFLRLAACRTAAQQDLQAEGQAAQTGRQGEQPGAGPRVAAGLGRGEGRLGECHS